MIKVSVQRSPQNTFLISLISCKVWLFEKVNCVCVVLMRFTKKVKQGNIALKYVKIAEIALTELSSLNSLA